MLHARQQCVGQCSTERQLSYRLPTWESGILVNFVVVKGPKSQLASILWPPPHGRQAHAGGAD